MARFFIAQLNVHDPAEYARYLEGTAALLEEFSGTVLAVDEDPEVLEGEWPYGRTVLIEFPTRDHLDRWYLSDGYRAIAVHRRAAATGNIVSIEGRG
jgi:uncharacterized protein (DUF1330 family)